MKVENLYSNLGHNLKGPLLLIPDIFDDNRGFFYESWNKATLDKVLVEDGQSPVNFLQDNHSRSQRGVCRGLHFQLPPHSQSKLVRCIAGQIFDVAVDIRRNSTTYGQWVGVNLSSDNHLQLWIPDGFAHGFMAISESAEVHYKTTSLWNKECERAINWKDPFINIAWPKTEKKPIVSAKDDAAPFLADQKCVF